MTTACRIPNLLYRTRLLSRDARPLTPTLCARSLSTIPKLVEVGQLQTPKLQGKYDSGQLFLHKVFGYRGVILFPWLAKVYDRDDAKWEDPGCPKDKAAGAAYCSENGIGFKSNVVSIEAISYTSAKHNRDVVGKTQTYYQTLIDSRDFPYINAQTESVTYLGMPDSGGSLLTVPGLDYVSHDDVLPYRTRDTSPIHNELFTKFFLYDKDTDPEWTADDTLRLWQKQNHPWLELSEVHRQTTNDVRITVTPFYMGLRESQNNQVYWWRYCIRIENLGKQAVQLRERHWRIFSLSGTLETVRGRGVVGKEPLLTNGEPAFQYSSHVSLQAPSGHMWGTFKMEKEDGTSFECKIPPFSLESKIDD